MQSFSQRRLAELDATLAQAPANRRERLLVNADRYWQNLYGAFIDEEDEHHPDGPQTIDLFLVLCGIHQRLAALHSPGGP